MGNSTELEKLRKKIADQQKLLREKDRLLAGTEEMQAAVDAILTEIVLEHGVIAKDEESGEELGWRLELHRFDVRQLREKYELRVMRALDGYRMAVCLREVPDGT